MNNILALVSYSLVTMAGICFVSDLAFTVMSLKTEVRKHEQHI